VRRLNEQLERERARAQQYLDVARVAFIALDSDGHVTLINKCGLELFGYEEAELVGKNWKKCPSRQENLGGFSFWQRL
jgi:PAS domain S-box-containing protein